MPQYSTPPANSRSRRDRGAMLLAVLFMMAIMVITAMIVAPALIQQAKRDREEEMIHRGTEYARAIKKYYKKFGRYPANLEQLENTNNMRFLRRRYKDPLTKDGQWRLLRYGDVGSLMGGIGGMAGMGAMGGMQGQMQGLNQLNPGQGLNGNSSGMGTTGTTFNTGAPQGAQMSPQQQSQFFNNQAAAGMAGAMGGQSALGGASAGAVTGASSGTDTSSTGGSSTGQGSSSSGSSSSGQSGSGQTGSNNTIFGNSGVGGQSFGGGAVVGVASKSTNPTIRIFNKKKNYNDWLFFYSPMFDLPNVLLRGPYNGQTAMQSQIGTPAGQLNQQQNGLGTQQLQNNQTTSPQLTPGSQFPPDQTQH